MKPLVLAELYAGVQISNKEVAVKSKLSNIMLKTRFPFIYASISRDTKTLTIASIRCLASQQIFRLSIFSAGFFFAFGNFARYCVVLLNAPPSDRDKKKKKSFCHGLLFPRNLDLASVTPGGLIIPLEAR